MGGAQNAWLYQEPEAVDAAGVAAALDVRYQHPSIRQECEAPGVVEAMRNHRHPDYTILSAEVLSGLADRGALRQGCGRIADSSKDRDDKTNSRFRR